MDSTRTEYHRATIYWDERAQNFVAVSEIARLCFVNSILWVYEVVHRGWRNGSVHDLQPQGREFESRLYHLCVLLLARKTCARANEHGFSWAARTLEKASHLGVCVYG